MNEQFEHQLRREFQRTMESSPDPIDLQPEIGRRIRRRAQAQMAGVAAGVIVLFAVVSGVMSLTGSEKSPEEIEVAGPADAAANDANDAIGPESSTTAPPTSLTTLVAPEECRDVVVDDPSISSSTACFLNAIPVTTHPPLTTMVPLSCDGVSEENASPTTTCVNSDPVPSTAPPVTCVPATTDNGSAGCPPDPIPNPCGAEVPCLTTVPPSPSTVPPTTSPPTNTTACGPWTAPPTTIPGTPDLDAYIGLTEAEARIQAESDGLAFRVVCIDEVSLAITADYSTDRVNVAMKDGRVVEAGRF